MVPGTNSSQLKMDAWKMKAFLLGPIRLFSGAFFAVSFWECKPIKAPLSVRKVGFPISLAKSPSLKLKECHLKRLSRPHLRFSGE